MGNDLPLCFTLDFLIGEIFLKSFSHEVTQNDSVYSLKPFQISPLMTL
jgi:hypothetical protein